MKISDSLEVDHPIQQVWDLLQQPRFFLSAMPGVQSWEAVNDTTFDTLVVQRVGPFRVQFQVRMTLDEVEAPRRLVASGQGTESAGSMLRVPSAVLELEELAEDRTKLSFEIDFSLTGKLGSLGSMMIRRKASEMSREFSNNLEAAARSAIQ
jgi:carbon monoxide dehydrogenase subunit G